MKMNASNYKLTLLGIAVTLLSLHSGCKKEKESSDPMTLLTSKKWKVVYKDDNPAANPTGKYIYYAELPCSLDDRYQYTKGGKYHSDGGEEKCQTDEVRLNTTDYTVDFTNKELTLFGTTLKILELTPNRLKLARALPPPNEWGILMFEH